ncbi:MAG: hypothetical protein KBF96_07845 [Ignavibacteria bacterium]|jgi:hypothetical protein|nr:hypothetical protein [Ignavibacteria bacterium]
MKTFILLFTSLVFYSCTSSLEPKEYTQSPCMDITYQKLLKMDIKDMTNSEVEYFKIKDRECKKYAEENSGPDAEKTKAKKNLNWILYGMVLVAGVIVSFALIDPR